MGQSTNMEIILLTYDKLKKYRIYSRERAVKSWGSKAPTLFFGIGTPNSRAKVGTKSTYSTNTMTKNLSCSLLHFALRLHRWKRTKSSVQQSTNEQQSHPWQTWQIRLPFPNLHWPLWETILRWCNFKDYAHTCNLVVISQESPGMQTMQLKPQHFLFGLSCKLLGQRQHSCKSFVPQGQIWPMHLLPDMRPPHGCLHLSFHDHFLPSAHNPDYIIPSFNYPQPKMATEMQSDDCANLTSYWNKWLKTDMERWKGGIST